MILKCYSLTFVPNHIDCTGPCRVYVCAFPASLTHQFPSISQALERKDDLTMKQEARAPLLHRSPFTTRRARRVKASPPYFS